MKRFLLATAALIAATTAAHAETVAITGGKLVIGDASAPIEGGTVVIRNGTVVAACANGVRLKGILEVFPNIKEARTFRAEHPLV